MNKRLLTLVYLIITLPAFSQINFSANDAGRVPSYNGTYRFGINGGVYGPTWDDKSVADIAAGNPAKNVRGAGGKTFRPALPEEFMEAWGYDIRVQEFTHYATLGVNDNTVFLENPSVAHRDQQTYTQGCGTPSQIGQSKIFKNLYEPIWDGGANGTPVNENNYYALYVYKTVTRYKNYTKFWEVVNEPDQTHGGTDNAFWWNTNPAPCDLSNLKAPIFYYIRMLRITYEVIKSVDPSAYIAPGGLGFASFLDVLLRNTDNPVDGSVTGDYPLKGGAYFDVLSFHGYPMYQLGTWSNTVNGFVYQRHSDAAVEAYIKVKKGFEDVLLNRGYNGITYPKKLFICTENNIPRKAFGNFIGGEEVQRNYMIKTAVESQKNGIVQNYMFVIGDDKWDWEADDPHQLMGMYKKLEGAGPFGNGGNYNVQYTTGGAAHKTVSDLLYGLRYDGGKTAALNLPANVKGGAFQDPLGKYMYVLWARTSADNSEAAFVNYSFPSGVVGANIEMKSWDYSVNAVSTVISSTNIGLTSSPVFLSEIGTTQIVNKLPIANAGYDASITLPTNALTLNGSASYDPDGTIVKYEWSKISGPEPINFVPITIVSPNSATTVVKNLIEGSFVFNLKIYDNNSGITNDQVTVIVKPDLTPIAPNIAGVANAGPDQSINGSTVTLDASASYDPDGAIKRYEWKYLSGPSQYSIANSAAVTTSVSNLVNGTYTFNLMIWDNQWVPAEDQVKIIIGAGGSTPPPPVPPPPPPPTGANIPPVPKAGADVSITLPANSTTLNGSGSYDPDGSINKFEWKLVSGPGTYTIANINAASTALTGLVQGTYTFALTIWDNLWMPAEDRVVINVLNGSTPPPPPPVTGANLPPLPNAGTDISVTLPLNSTTLNGSGSYDPDGSINKYEWKLVSGPGTYTIANINAASTSLTGLVQGTYTFALTTWDNQWMPAEDKVIVNVHAAEAPPPPPPSGVNAPPVPNAGADATITLPTNSITLNGAGSYDPDGSINRYEWKYISGPTQYNISNTGIASPSVGNLVQGTYTFGLTIWDNQWLPAEDWVVITVNGTNATPGVNMSPVAKAGNDISISSTQTSVSLNGIGSFDPDGTINKFEWRKESGPSATITNANNVATTVTGLVAGTYVFVLKVWDNLWVPSEDALVITVTAQAPPVTGGNAPPVSNAGTDMVIALPGTSATLNGSGSYDPDGSLNKYEWSKESGPIPFSISNINSATTTVTGLVQGTYVFVLRVWDNAWMPSDDRVIVTVGSGIGASSGVVIAEQQGALIVTEQKLSLHPNPAVNNLHLRMVNTDLGNVVMNVYDVGGRLMKSQRFVKSQSLFEQQMDVSSYTPGVYLIELITNNLSKRQAKFIKQ